MAKKKGWKLTEGSKYRIISIGAKDSVIETEGIFRGFATLGMDEVGLCIERNKGKKKMIRIIPLQVILAIDVLSEKEEKQKETEEESPPGFYT
ncbi:MAG TPA: hypothetical protein ENL44_03585 [Thermoplasmatales archaeon]|nr:hypothetical protein [Thermoplasmata archaeon]HHF59262.1 hypothetical protein [Thermoplasmatales archaeon]